MNYSSSSSATVPAPEPTDQILEDLSMLIVEDQFIVAVGIEKTFRDAGARNVRIAGTMEDAWAAIKEEDFDAALLDIRLPDGYSFPLALKLFGDGMPVVMHSGHAEIYHSAKLPGIIFCPKPATPVEVVDSVIKAQRLSIEGSSPLAS